MDANIILEIIKKNLKSAIIIFKKNKELLFINEHAIDLLHTLNLEAHSFYEMILNNNIENKRNKIKINDFLIGYSIEFDKAQDYNYSELVIFQDITHIKNKEKEKNETKQREALGELAMYVAHEMKNSLNIIRGYSQLMLESHKISYIHNNLNIFIEEADRLNKLAYSVLNYTKKGSMELRKLDLINLTKNIIEKNFKNKNIELFIENEVLEIFADKDKLIQLYINLIQNGLEEIKGDGIFNIKLKKVEANKVQLIFETDAVVDSEFDINQIFLETYTSKKDGTGLGLSICKKIMEEHLGSIEVSLNEYQGLSFIIHFPLIYGR